MACPDVQALLPAFRDDELSVEEQVSVRAHLHACAVCSAELEGLEALGETLRAASHARLERYADDVASLYNRVVPGIIAERQQALPQRLARWRDDLHMIWALGAATLASLACLFAGLGIMRLTLREVPSSMAAIIGALATPGSDRNPLSADGRMLLPSFDDAAPAVVVSSDQEVLALSAVVTREGRVSRVELVMPSASRLPHQNAVHELLDAAAQTRFEPARAGGAPVAVNVIWLLAHTTVVGKDGAEVQMTAPPVQRPVPGRRQPSRPAITEPISQSVHGSPAASV